MTTEKEVLPKKYVLSADIGQMADYTALGVLDVTDSNVSNLVYLKRLKLRTPYPEVVKIIKTTFEELLKKAGERGEVVLVVDCTGVGRPIVDMLQAAGLSPIAVTITGGNEATHEGREWHVPKRDLVAACQVLMQQRRLKAAEGISAYEDFVKELESFKYKINIATGHDSYEAWRESIHDDLVLCVCMACWVPGHVSRPSIRRLW